MLYVREVCQPLNSSIQFSSVQSLSCVQLFVTPWTSAHQASLSITNSWSLPKLMSIKLVMPSSHLILCCPLLLLPPIPPSIRVSSNESTLRMRWPKYWNFSFNTSPSNEHPELCLPLELLRVSHAPRRAVCGNRGFFRTTHTCRKMITAVSLVNTCHHTWLQSFFSLVMRLFKIYLKRY